MTIDECLHDSNGWIIIVRTKEQVEDCYDRIKNVIELPPRIKQKGFKNGLLTYFEAATEKNPMCFRINYIPSELMLGDIFGYSLFDFYIGVVPSDKFVEYSELNSSEKIIDFDNMFEDNE